MLSAAGWEKNQPNTILFVLVDSSGEEVTGLGSSFVLRLSKSGAAFSFSEGTKSEVGLGWYKYISTSGEADTSGPIAVAVTGSGIVQQNLEYVVEDRIENAISFTYTVTSTSGGVPIEGVEVLVYTDSAGINYVWAGRTDAFGVARDEYGNLPRLAPGTYHFFRYKSSYSFYNPDEETVSV